MNTHESYVSLEMAKMLKEAGFDWECDYYYYLDNYYALPEFHNVNITEKPCIGTCYSAPTLAVAQRWLREKNLLLYICPLHSDGKWLWRYWFVIYINKEDITQIYSVENYNTYEEAQEAGTKRALEIILEKGEYENN